MKDISGPVIAIALILAAVFVPVGFIPGIVGRLYQQFAITIAISVLISALLHFHLHRLFVLYFCARCIWTNHPEA